LFVAGGDELEEQVRGVVVEGDVADLVDLCRHPHRSTYADYVIMPMWPRNLSNIADRSGIFRRTPERLSA
jgi:hypothetical protein